MADKPIIFNGAMVRALLDGRKTQTRRVVRDVPDRPAMDNIAWPDTKLHAKPYLDAYCGSQKTAENPRGMTDNWAYWTRDNRPGRLSKVGFVPGDRLWVREAWTKLDDNPMCDLAMSGRTGISTAKRPAKAGWFQFFVLDYAPVISARD